MGLGAGCASGMTNKSSSQSTVEPGVPVGRRGRRALSRRARRVRLVCRVFVGTGLGVLLLVLVLMRSPVVAWVVADELEVLTGLEFEASSSVIGLDGRLVVRDLVMRLPGVDGEAGALLEAERADVMLDWSGVLRGDIEARSLWIRSPVIRVSESSETGELNLGALAGRGGVGGTGGVPASLPRIDITGGIIEFGRHGPGAYEHVKRVAVDGSVTPVSSTQPVYTIGLTEGLERAPTGASRAEERLLVDGRFDLERADLDVRVRNVELARWPAGVVPAAYRSVWERLGLRGTVSSVRIRYRPDAGVSADIALDGVAMDALVPVLEPSTGPEDPVPTVAYLSLREVFGVLSLSPDGLDADVSGRLDGQTFPIGVQLKTGGLSLDAPLRCVVVADRFRVAKTPVFLPHVPATVREYLRTFSGPTGEVDTRVEIVRAEERGAISVQGTLSLVDGTAAFEKFPYPFEQIAGTVRFTERRLDIDGLTGVSASGARLNASGWVEPLTDDAEAHVDVIAEDVPIDDLLRDSIPDSKDDLIDTLFDVTSYERLRSSGLLAGGEGGFELGGVADVRVRVRRPFGKKVRWDWDVTVSLARAGIVVSAFPLPIVGEDVELHIDDDVARVEAGRFRCAHGGDLDLSAQVTLRDGQEAVAWPEVSLSAVGVPVDELLLSAIPEDATPRDGRMGEEGLSVRTMLRRLGVMGEVSCSAKIIDRGEDDGGLRFDVNVDLADVRARPAEVDQNGGLFEIGSLSGTVRVRENGAAIEALRGKMRVASDEQGVWEPVGRFELDLEAPFSLLGDASAGKGEPAAGVSARARIEDLALSAPLERVVNVVSVEGAQRVRGLRERYQPRGVADTVLEVESGPDGGVRVDAEVSGLEGVSVLARIGQVGMDGFEGSVRVRSDDLERWSISPERSGFSLSVGRDPLGVFSVDGVVELQGERVVGGTGIDVRGTGVRLESDLVRRAMGEKRALVEREGVASARLLGSLRGVVGGEARVEVDGGVTRASGRVEPSEVSVLGSDGVWQRAEVSGVVTFDVEDDGDGSGARAWGAVESLRAQSDFWGARADGSWWWSEEGAGFDLRAGGSVRDEEVSVVRLLPEGVRRVAEQIELRTPGGVRLDDGSVAVGFEGDEVVSWSFGGDVTAQDASASVGVEISGFDGTVRVLAGAERDSEASATLTADADRVLVAGVELTDASARLQRVPGGGVEIDRVTAGCHGGRISGKIRVDPAVAAVPGVDGVGDDGVRLLRVSGGNAGDGSGTEAGGAGGGESWYRADVMISGAGFGAILADVERAAALRELDFESASDVEADPTRGDLDAWFSIEGLTGDLRSRVGRGSIRIARGDVVRLPVLFPLVQMSNLQLPRDDSLNYLETAFYISGPTMMFDRISVMGETIELVGRGTVTWPDYRVDMLFNSRGTSRVPVVSDLFEALRDEVVTTRITGTVGNPEVGGESFSTVRGLVGSVLEPTEGLRGGGDAPVRSGASAGGAGSGVERGVVMPAE